MADKPTYVIRFSDAQGEYTRVVRGTYEKDSALLVIRRAGGKVISVKRVAK